MEVNVLLVLLVFIAGFIIGYFFSKKQSDLEKNNRNDENDFIKNTFKALAGDVAKSNSEEFLKLANVHFEKIITQNNSELDKKKTLIDDNLNKMSSKLDKIQLQSKQLETTVDLSNKETQKLRDTTNHLREILSSSQKRGQWGERIVEDILRFLGLVENINYNKQAQLESGERPDFTFYLPKSKKINMDIKFPLDHYENYIDSDDDLVKNKERKSFLNDVKNHIKSITNRTYINLEDGTLDYVLMFIPNESIYAFINKEDQKIIDYALSNKVLLCSPLTLYAILSLLHQATINFAMEQKANEVIGLLNKFKIQWTKYLETFDKMGRSIESVKNDYENLITTRSRQLEKPLNKITQITEDAALENKKVSEDI